VRDSFGALRASTPQLWARLPLKEKSRFLQHLRAYWDVHRHRCAPTEHRKFDALRASGVVSTIQGRLKSIVDRGDHLEVGVCLRDRPNPPSRFHPAWLLNCTGPNLSLRRAGSPLIRTLLQRGIIDPDCLDLGIEVAENYAVKGRDGAISTMIHYVGPMLRAQYWEATAVPELRSHVARLARYLSRAAVPLA